MSNEKQLPTSTDLLIRAFILAFFVPVLYTSTSANFVQWHVSIIVLFGSFYLAFKLLRTYDRILTFTTIFILAIVSLTFLGVQLANSYPQSEYGPFYSFAIGLLALIAAFVWPKGPITPQELDFSEGDNVHLVVGKSEPDAYDGSTHELTIPAVVSEVEEMRVKLRHKDPHGNEVESWCPLNAIRPIEDVSRD